MGISGRIAQAFIRSKLTPLVAITSLAVGALALIATPREEEPQISVPMIDVIVAMPGVSPEESERLLAVPLEKRIWEIPGVDYVYSMAGAGYAMVTARFDVGENQEESITKVYAKVFAGMDEAPPGALPPLVKPHAIDDVPILTLTLHSERYSSNDLRRVATHLEEDIRTIDNVAATSTTGGEPKQIAVEIGASRVAASGVSVAEVAMATRSANARLQAGEFSAGNAVYRVDAIAPLTTAADVGSIVVAARNGRPVYIRDVAEVREGFADATNYVSHTAKTGNPENAVTISVAKRKGANATHVAEQVLTRVMVTSTSPGSSRLRA